MYYPKSQIKTNLYTKGEEFTIGSSQDIYIGYYYQTSNGQFYTGKTPNNNQPNLPLFLINSPLDPSSTTKKFSNFWTSNFTQYKPKILKKPPPSPPTSTYPIPTYINYQTGEFERYFLKKSNEAKFIEISKEDYEMYINKDNSVSYELYIPTKISWILKGNKDQVYQTNKNIVGKVEREQNYYGFTSYFKDNFTQFYQ